MTQTTLTLALYDTTLTRLTREAERRGMPLEELIAELLTLDASRMPDPPGDTGDERDYLTTAEAAELLHLQPRTVSTYCRDGRIYGTRVGKGWRIQRSEIDAYNNRNTR